MPLLKTLQHMGERAFSFEKKLNYVRMILHYGIPKIVFLNHPRQRGSWS